MKMKRNYTVKELIVMYLRMNARSINKTQYTLRNSSLQTKLPAWVKETFDVMHAPETYSRGWRELREKDGLELAKYDLMVTDREMPNSDEKHFRITLLKPLAPLKPVVPDTDLFKDDPDTKMLEEVFGKVERLA